MIAPCIICGKVLREVYEGHTTNQPYEGVCAVIYGNYGSTVFDPMFDGTHLEINICDECLVKAGERGRVLSGRLRKSARMNGMIVGYEAIDMPLVEWHEGLAPYGDFLELEPDEDLSLLPDRVHINEVSWKHALKLGAE